MVTLQTPRQRAFTFGKVSREPAFRHVQIKSFSSGSESDEETSFTKGNKKKSFIFEEDYHMLVSKITQEKQGNLFGLWTTDGEPVIHIVCPSICIINPHSHTEDDILSKTLPLAHIGNWRYRLFTIYMEKPVGRWFVQMESKIPILEISVWGGVYHLNNRPNLPKEPRATLTSSKWRLKSLYSTRL